MKTTTLRELIRESIQGYIREIDMVSEVAAIESKIAEAKNAIEERNNKLSKADELNESGLIDEKIVKKLQKEVALLEKYASKQEALLEKKKAKMKGKNKEVDDDMITEEPMEMDEVDGLEEMDYKDDSMEEAKEEMEEEYLNESFIRMQKLAGLITETQYRKKAQILNEDEDKTLNETDTLVIDGIAKNIYLMLKKMGFDVSYLKDHGNQGKYKYIPGKTSSNMSVISWKRSDGVAAVIVRGIQPDADPKKINSQIMSSFGKDLEQGKIEGNNKQGYEIIWDIKHNKK
jgi:hypothetical protein